MSGSCGGCWGREGRRNADDDDGAGEIAAGTGEGWMFACGRRCFSAAGIGEWTGDLGAGLLSPSCSSDEPDGENGVKGPPIWSKFCW